MAPRRAASREPVRATPARTARAGSAASDEEGAENAISISATAADPVAATPGTRRRRAKNSAEPAMTMPLRRSARLSSKGPTGERSGMTPVPVSATITTTTTSTAPLVDSVPEDVEVEVETVVEEEVRVAVAPSGSRFAEDGGALPLRAPTESVLVSRSVTSSKSTVPSSKLNSARQRIPSGALSARSSASGTRRVSGSQMAKQLKSRVAEHVHTPARPQSRLFRWLRFPLVVVSSMLLNTIIYFILDSYGIFHGELARVSTPPEHSWPVGVVFGWRVLELGISWMAGFDDYDVLSLTVLTHFPHLLFLNTFYCLKAFPLVCVLLTDAVASTLPFALLRTRSSHHSFLGPDSPMSQIRRNVIADTTTATITILLAALVYAISLVASYRLSILLPILAFNFEGLETFEVAREWAASPSSFGSRSLPALAGMLLPLGCAARALLFTPAAAIPPSEKGAVPESGSAPVPDVVPATPIGHEFDPVNATLGETIRYNLTPPAAITATRTRVLSFRTVVLVAVGLANAAIRTGGTIKGGNWQGGVAWGAVWAGANVAVSLIYWWVGHV